MPDDIEKLIPHRAPMRWIDALLDCGETTASAGVSFGPDHFAVANGAVLESALVECVAQTVAVALSHRARTQGGLGSRANGMLAAVSDFVIQSPAPLGTPLRIDIREIKRFGSMLLAAGVISCEEQIIASGELTVYA